MVIIKQNRILSLNISFDIDFSGGDVLAQSSVSLKPIIVPSDKDSVHLFVDFNFTCESMKDDFDLNAELVMPFHLTNKSEIKQEDFYKCIDFTKDRLQKIINSIFEGQKNSLIVAPIEIDEISDKLDEHIQNLR